MNNPSFTPEAFVLDVDGVLTDGGFYYSSQGKQFKMFGPDDNDALSLLRAYVKIQFVTGDRKGYSISEKRVVQDMGFPLELVSTIKRIDWIRERWDPRKVIYMGDGIFDHYVARQVAYSIAPANADTVMKESSQFVCKRSGGDRAVAEACLHVMEKFFQPYNPLELPTAQAKLSGEWTV